MSKMSIEKAIAILRDGVNAKTYKEQIDARNIAIEALKKQIPIKVSIYYDDEFTCPVCGNTTEDYDVTTINVCPECGQKLRWD